MWDPIWDPHPSVGRRFPNLPLRSSTSGASCVFELLQNQDFVLLDLTGSVIPSVPEGLRLKIGAIEKSCVGDDLSGLATVLLRPDGHVACVIERPLDEYFPMEELSRWLKITV
jgi:hypothetical protein